VADEDQSNSSGEPSLVILLGMCKMSGTDFDSDEPHVEAQQVEGLKAKSHPRRC
jgi:hypothetical protein